MRRLALGLAFLVLAAGRPVSAEETVRICFNYDCHDTAAVTFDRGQMKTIAAQFVGADSPEAEREAIAQAMAFFYFFAGEQTPTWRDRGGNFADDGVDGRMDCIDHSTNTTRYLELVERSGLLRFHGVGEPVRRGWFLSIHWGARITENGSGGEYVVDTWFLDPGYPATIYPLDEWKSGRSPDERSLWSVLGQ